MDEDEIIRQIFKNMHAINVKVPQTVKEIIKDHGMNLNSLVRTYLTNIACELEKDDPRLMKYRELTGK